MTSNVCPGLISHQPSAYKAPFFSCAMASQIVSEVVFLNFKPAHAGDWTPKKPAAKATAITILRTIVSLLVVNLTTVSGEKYDLRAQRESLSDARRRRRAPCRPRRPVPALYPAKRKIAAGCLRNRRNDPGGRVSPSRRVQEAGEVGYT